MSDATSNSLSPLAKRTVDYMVTKVIRAAIYIRVSTDKQEEEGESLETQEARCLQLASDLGYQVDAERHIYREVFTGTVLDRPVLNTARADANNNEFDVLIFYAYDRLARKQVLQAVILQFFASKNIKLLSVTENFDNSAIGQFMRNTAAFAAEYELEKLKERTSRGRTSILNKGQLLGGGRPTYGYTWRPDKRGYLIDLQEAEMIDLIFDWYTIEKWSIYAIVLHLREKYPNRNRKGTWGTSTIGRILHNAYYIGKGNVRKWQYDDEPGSRKNRMRSHRPEEEQKPVAEGVVPPIIDEKRFNIAQERLAINKQLSERNNYNPEMALLRAGFAICGNCGFRLHAARKAPQKDGTKEKYVYACHEDGSIGRCKKVSIKCDGVDIAAWEYVLTFIKDPLKMEERLAEIERILSKKSADLTPIEEHLAEINRRERNLAAAIVQSPDPVYMKNLLDQEAATLKKDRQDAEKLRSEVMRHIGEAENIRLITDRFRQKWSNYKERMQEEITYQDKREAIVILGLRATIYSVGHLPRYKFQIVPPEIESLTLLRRVERLLRP